MHALLSMTQLMQILHEAGCIDKATVQKVENYLATTKVDESVMKKSVPDSKYEGFSVSISHRLYVR